jgi:hypothetical protein
MTIKTTTEKEVIIDYPYYCRHNNEFAKLISDTEYINIMEYENINSHQYKHNTDAPSMAAYFYEKYAECTSLEFRNAFAIFLNYINKQY